MLADQIAKKLQSKFVARVKSSGTATDWSVVENNISISAAAVYGAIVFKPWQPEALLREAYSKSYARAGVTKSLDETSFTMPNPAAEAWLLKYSSQEVTMVTESERKCVQAILAQGLNSKQTNKRIAQDLKQTLGLNEPQAKAWLKYCDNLRAQGMPKHKVDKLGDAYRNRLLRRRAETVALTESHTATNRAFSDSVKEQYRTGLLDDSFELVWMAARVRLCDKCGTMDGKTAPIGTMDFGGHGIPPLHPRCRCVVVVRKKR